MNELKNKENTLFGIELSQDQIDILDMITYPVAIAAVFYRLLKERKIGVIFVIFLVLVGICVFIFKLLVVFFSAFV